MGVIMQLAKPDPERVERSEQGAKRGGRVLLAKIAVLVLGTVAFYVVWAAQLETPGERFDKYMTRWTERCAKMTLGRGETTCDILNLKPRSFEQTKLVPVAGQPEPVPEEWLATPEGRFAHSIKIPNPVPKDSGYTSGMTSQEYFDHLCKTEAGEFIYKAATNVESIFQIRPFEHATDNMLKHLFALEDPYTNAMEGSFAYTGKYVNAEFGYVGPGRYQLFESRVSPRKPSWPKDPCLKDMDDGYKDEGMPIWKYWGFVSWRWSTSTLDRKVCGSPMRAKNETAPVSQYGYVWRGVSRTHDRELGIAGGELIILDLVTKDVLAVRRNFAKTGEVQNNLTGIWWLTAGSCPGVATLVKNKLSKETNLAFITKALQPRSAKARQDGGDIK
jgi:hypothetical protein